MNYYYYLLLTPPGKVGSGVVQALFTDEAPFRPEGPNVGPYLEIPEQTVTLIGSLYLGDVEYGITVLGSDYLSLFEAPPAPGCYWDGEQWVCPPQGEAIAE